MSRTLSLFTIVSLTFAGPSSAAPAQNATDTLVHIASVQNDTASLVYDTPVQSATYLLVTDTPTQSANATLKHTKRSTTYSGTATFFHPATEGGPIGSCGSSENNNSSIVALNAPQYGYMSKKSSWCGKKINIKSSACTATATVNDACPECGYGSLDLTPVLFKKVVGVEPLGVGAITWSLS